MIVRVRPNELPDTFAFWMNKGPFQIRTGILIDLEGKTMRVERITWIIKEHLHKKRR